MPTVLLINGFRFFFYSNENNEPIHIHVTKGAGDGKVWLEPNITIAYMYGFSSSEEKDIMQLIFAHHEQFKNKWNEYFTK
jgi:hypothetical protein